MRSEETERETGGRLEPHTHPDRLLCVCGERRKGLKRRRRRKGDWEYPGGGHLGVRGHPQMLPRVFIVCSFALCVSCGRMVANLSRGTEREVAKRNV